MEYYNQSYFNNTLGSNGRGEKMKNWGEGELINWILEKENPSVRFFTLTKILGNSLDTFEVKQVRKDIMQIGPVPQILALQNPDGWWGSADNATMPMYTSTAWQLMILAELGATKEDLRIDKAVDFVFRKAQDKAGAFPHEGSRWQKVSSMDLICNDGMIAWGLIGVGTPYANPSMKLTVDFLASAINHTDFKCRFNQGAPCAWGLVKALRVLAAIPKNVWTLEIKQAVEKAVNFILEKDLSKADYPTKPGGKVSGHWFKFGFPRSYQTDVLQTTRILIDLGYSKDKRMMPAVDFLLSKRLNDGTWPLEETFNKMLVPFVKKSNCKPSKWVTWQVLYILKKAGK